MYIKHVHNVCIVKILNIYYYIRQFFSFSITNVSTHTHTHTHTHARARTYIYGDKYLHTHAYIRPYIHTYIYCLIKMMTCLNCNIPRKLQMKLINRYYDIDRYTNEY